MLVIGDVQKAFEDEAQKAAATTTQNTAATTTVEATTTQQAAGAATTVAGSTTPQPAGAATTVVAAAGQSQEELLKMQSYFKSMGIDMSLEDIVNTAKAAKKPAPAEEEITVDDAEVEQYFTSQNKKDKYTTYKSLKAKTDIELVTEFKKEKILEKHPTWTDDQINAFVKRQYFQDEEGFYEDDEKEFGSTALANDASSIRETIDGVMDGAKSTIKAGKAKKSQDQQFAAQVDSILSSTNQLSFTLGTSGQKELGNWDFPLHAETKEKAKQAVISPEAFAKYVSDPATGRLDLKKVLDMVISYETRESLAKSIATEYHSRGVSEVESKLGDGVDLHGDRSGGNGASDIEKQNASQVGKYVGTQFR